MKGQAIEIDFTADYRPRAGTTGPNPPTYRNTDPGTSREAADRANLNRDLTLVLDALHAAGPDGLNTDELATRLNRIHVKNGLSRRMTDLGEMGLAHVIGKRPGLSGRNQQVWAIMDTDAR